MAGAPKVEWRHVLVVSKPPRVLGCFHVDYKAGFDNRPFVHACGYCEFRPGASRSATFSAPRSRWPTSDKLYGVEKELRQRGIGDWKDLDRQDRFARIVGQRQARSLLVLKQFGEWLVVPPAG